MPKYLVTVIKPVSDYLKATVEIEASSEEAATDLAFEMAAADRLTFAFSHSGESLEETTAEAEETL